MRWMRGNHHTFAEEKKGGKVSDRWAGERDGARRVRAGLSRLESAQAGMRSLAAAAAAQRPAAAIEFFDKLAPTPGALFGRGRVAGCARMSTRKSDDARARCGLARGRRTIGASRRTVGRKPRRAMTADMNEAGARPLASMRRFEPESAEVRARERVRPSAWRYACFTRGPLRPGRWGARARHARRATPGSTQSIS
ncbi:hypothetical protein [Burkholderia pseudomallei]|uniref:hypothetical protein n=1 Tax=Burkholderia pseudomallei TaxID=28450 RepID=UPI001E5B958D|nr:hypothetical protein [Burkholderia pseudomallei]